MKGKRYTDEFKKEAVKQVTERGYSVSEVAERLGTTTHSLYLWLKKFGEASPRQAAALARGRATRARNLRAKSPRGAAGRKLKQAGGSRRRSRSRSRSRR